jgi:hypothetical protein
MESRIPEGNDVGVQPTERQRGLFFTILLSVVCIFVPFVGHVILTFMIANDYLTTGEKIIWLIAVWAVPFLGAFLYLLVGQRHHRLFGGQPAM